MKKPIVMLLLMMMLTFPVLALELPKLYGIVGYDLVLKDQVAGVASGLLTWSILDLNVGYLTSNADQIWVGGISVDIKGLAEKCRITYGWENVKARLGFYGGYDFDDKNFNYGIQIAVIEI